MLGKDLRNGRIYLPQEDLARFDYTEEDLRQQKYNDSFVRLMEFEAARAEEVFREPPRLSAARGSTLDGGGGNHGFGLPWLAEANEGGPFSRLRKGISTDRDRERQPDCGAVFPSFVECGTLNNRQTSTIRIVYIAYYESEIALFIVSALTLGALALSSCDTPTGQGAGLGRRHRCDPRRRGYRRRRGSGHWSA